MAEKTLWNCSTGDQIALHLKISPAFSMYHIIIAKFSFG